MTWTLSIILVFLPAAFLAQDFAGQVYPVLERAQCRTCHNDNGVASATRVQFPREGAAAEEVAAFGMHLQVVVKQGQPDASLLFLKPTNRVAHAGGERIKRGSEDEKILRAWVERLAALPESSAVQTQRLSGTFRRVLRRLTHSQYNHTVRDLLGDETRPADQFPREDFVSGFTNQAEGQPVSPLLAEAYARAAERLASAAFRGGDSRFGALPVRRGRLPQRVYPCVWTKSVSPAAQRFRSQTL